MGVGVDSGIGLSPSVYANSFTLGDPVAREDLLDPVGRSPLSEETTLVALILWRDEPGWFLRTDGEAVSGMQSGSWRPDEVWETIARVGPPGRPFNLAWNAEARVMRIEGTEVPLGDDNVILVDGAASNEGMEILGTRRVAETRFRMGDTGALIRQSDELREYLRCEVPLPDDLAAPNWPERYLEQYFETMHRHLGRICEGMPSAPGR